MMKVADYLYRGPRPNSIKELVDEKINISLSLEEGFYEAFHNDEYEKRDEIFTNIKFMKFPLGDVFPPSVEALANIAWIINLAIAKNKNILVHCLHGVDRTGMAIAAWKILYNNTSVDDAIKEMKQLGFHSFPYFYWIPILRRL